MDSVLERLTAAQNAHHVERLASWFAEGYVSEQPLHPARGFSGRDQVIENWAAVFAGVPDFHAELVSSTVVGEVEWAEVAWRGHHTDGSPFAMGGVLIATIRADKIVAARLYVEPVEDDGEVIDAAVEELYRPPR